MTTRAFSADERTATCRALANPNAGAGYFAGGAVITFPLIANDGGVDAFRALPRRRSTFAAWPACRQSASSSELMNDDWRLVSRKGAQVSRFAAEHKLKHVTIDDLIAYRQAREKLIERLNSFTCNFPVGLLQGHALSLALRPRLSTSPSFWAPSTAGDGRDVLVRYLSLASSTKCNRVAASTGKVRRALERIKAEGRGVLLIYLRDGRRRRAPVAPPWRGRADHARRRSAAASGARSASARRSCAISASPQSATCRRASTPISACPALGHHGQRAFE